MLGVCNCNIALLVLWCSGERGSIGGSRGRYLDGDAGALIIGHWWLLLVLLLVFELLVLCLVFAIVTVLWCSGERGRIGGSRGSQWQPLTDNSIALPVLILVLSVLCFLLLVLLATMLLKPATATVLVCFALGYCGTVSHNCRLLYRPA